MTGRGTDRGWQAEPPGCAHWSRRRLAGDRAPHLPGVHSGPGGGWLGTEPRQPGRGQHEKSVTGGKDGRLLGQWPRDDGPDVTGYLGPFRAPGASVCSQLCWGERSSVRVCLSQHACPRVSTGMHTWVCAHAGTGRRRVAVHVTIPECPCVLSMARRTSWPWPCLRKGHSSHRDRQGTDE